MRAIILAAGRGSRMNDLTEQRPKCLVELHGRPLLEWQIDALSQAGLADIGIVAGYRREMLVRFGLEMFVNERWMSTNMVSSLEAAAAWLSSDVCIVSYSDIFYDASAVASLMGASSDIAVTYDKNWLKLWQKRFGDPLIDAETFKLRSDGILLEIGHKPTSIDDIHGQYMGLVRFTPTGWAEVARIRASLSQDERDKMHMTGTLQKVIEEGRVNIMALPYEKAWGEVDSAADLASYDQSG